MPKWLEKQLSKSGSKKGLTGDRLNAYIYGTMNKMGAMHGNKETDMGKHMKSPFNKK